MSGTLTPTVRRRRLAFELRRLREAAKLTCEDVADLLECSASKISRMETARITVSPRDVRDLLRIYGVPDDQHDSLIQLARESRQKGWWHAYGDSVQPHWRRTWEWKAPPPRSSTSTSPGFLSCCRPRTTRAR